MTQILLVGALKNVWRTVWRICILGTLRLRMGASIENVITEESLARVRRRLRGKFGVNTHSNTFGIWKTSNYDG